MKNILFLLLALTAASCAQKVNLTPSSKLNITVIHTNDIHGRAWPFLKEDGTKKGGYAAQSQLIQKLKKETEEEGGVFLLLSGGDVNTGVPESDFSEAEPDFLAMQAIGYDAMVVGNHDLDHGLSLLLKQASWVKFPLLAANLKSAKTKAGLFQGSTIIKKKDLSFGVIGITTEELKNLILPSHSKDLIVKDAINSARLEMAALKKQGAQVFIALSHMGVRESGVSLHRFTPSDDQTLAKEIPDLDLVVGGHSHTFLKNGLKEGKTLIVQAGYRGDFLGKVRLVFDKEKGEVTQAQAELVAVDPQEGEDPNITKLVQPYRDKYLDDLEKPVFRSKNLIIGQRLQGSSLEIPLGNLICDSLRHEMKTDFAFFNSGGLRASLPAGTVKKRDILEAFPFKNQVSTGVLRGSEVVSLLNDGLRNGNFAGGVLQVSGLQYFIQNSKIKQVLVNGALIQPNKDYTFATNSYVAESGDKLKTIRKARKRINHAQTVDDVIVKYGSSLKMVEAKIEERIILVE